MQNQNKTDSVDITPAQLNNFFTSIGPKMEFIKIPQSTCAFDTPSNEKSTFLFPACIPETYNVCRGLSNSQAVETDCLNKLFVKFRSPVICKPLVSLFNKSMSEGCYSNLFNIAKVFFVFKSGDLQNPIIFRPNSLLSSLSNIFEKILQQKYYGFSAYN